MVSFLYISERISFECFPWYTDCILWENITSRHCVHEERPRKEVQGLFYTNEKRSSYEKLSSNDGCLDPKPVNHLIYTLVFEFVLDFSVLWH